MPGSSRARAPGYGVRVASPASTQARPRSNRSSAFRSVALCTIRCQVWVAAAVQSLLQVRGDGGAPLLFGEPGTPLGPRLGQLSGGCTQYICQDGLYGAAGGGRVFRVAGGRQRGPVRGESRRSGRWPGVQPVQCPATDGHRAWRAGCGPRRPGPRALARRLRRYVLAEDRVDHAIE